MTDRMWQKVQKTDSCWLWLGNSDRGYGKLKRNGKTTGVHRIAYEELRGPIPEGLTLDHLCRVPNCVNPEHLEPVTIKENILRGTAPSAWAARSKSCANGHSWAEHGRVTGGQRRCFVCDNERAARYRAMYRNAINQRKRDRRQEAKIRAALGEQP